MTVEQANKALLKHDINKWAHKYGSASKTNLVANGEESAAKPKVAIKTK